MKTDTLIKIAAISLGTAVIFGAFGAHALKDVLTPNLMQAYQTGVAYHFYHSLGMLIIGLIKQARPSLRLLGCDWWLLSGTVLFSGSLYIMSITGIRILGMITPLGGICFIIGWFTFAFAIHRTTRD
ncbi:MAG: hypothetical protein CMF25_03025 [Kangiellaceae bacterium]|nr:hypothetical protein [Kangiellaceae bacterium]|tara:strand:+ start:3470 stop:3850 length:381 start_codon:yes stop_codon:yes gene_type:complete